MYFFTTYTLWVKKHEHCQPLFKNIFPLLSVRGSLNVKKLMKINSPTFKNETQILLNKKEAPSLELLLKQSYTLFFIINSSTVSL
nr:MAG TPA: hypothetical protein [Caudoviricetes sp.]